MLLNSSDQTRIGQATPYRHIDFLWHLFSTQKMMDTLTVADVRAISVKKFNYLHQGSYVLGGVYFLFVQQFKKWRTDFVWKNSARDANILPHPLKAHLTCLSVYFRLYFPIEWEWGYSSTQWIVRKPFCVVVDLSCFC